MIFPGNDFQGQQECSDWESPAPAAEHSLAKPNLGLIKPQFIIWHGGRMIEVRGRSN